MTPTLFDVPPPPRARATDAPTSHAAARSLDPDKVGRQMLAALAVIARAGDTGATNGEVADTLGRDRGNTARRVTDLLAAGLAEPTGDVRRAATGRLQRVVRATDTGRRALERQDQQQ